MNASLAGLIGTGFLLGWSIAWPPGPNNAEIARRALSRGFWAGYAVLLGGALGDAVWALGAAFGVGAMRTLAGLHGALTWVSVLLLVGLAAMFLRAAWRGARGGQAAARTTSPAFESDWGGFLLGLSVGLASPFNVAFWLAVMGRPELGGLGLSAMFVLAGSVSLGSMVWGLVWTGGAAWLGRAAGGRGFAVVANLASAALMLFFAARSALS